MVFFKIHENDHLQLSLWTFYQRNPICPFSRSAKNREKCILFIWLIWRYALYFFFNSHFLKMLLIWALNFGTLLKVTEKQWWSEINFFPTQNFRHIRNEMKRQEKCRIHCDKTQLMMILMRLANFQAVVPTCLSKLCHMLVCRAETTNFYDVDMSREMCLTAI